MCPSRSLLRRARASYQTSTITSSPVRVERHDSVDSVASHTMQRLGPSSTLTGVAFMIFTSPLAVLLVSREGPRKRTLRAGISRLTACPLRVQHNAIPRWVKVHHGPRDRPSLRSRVHDPNVAVIAQHVVRPGVSRQVAESPHIDRVRHSLLTFT